MALEEVDPPWFRLAATRCCHVRGQHSPRTLPPCHPMRIHKEDAAWLPSRVGHARFKAARRRSVRLLAVGASRLAERSILPQPLLTPTLVPSAKSELARRSFSAIGRIRKHCLRPPPTCDGRAGKTSWVGRIFRQLELRGLNSHGYSTVGGGVDAELANAIGAPAIRTAAHDCTGATAAGDE
jgi:hypothetical protein